MHAELAPSVLLTEREMHAAIASELGLEARSLVVLVRDTSGRPHYASEAASRAYNVEAGRIAYRLAERAAHYGRLALLER